MNKLTDAEREQIRTLFAQGNKKSQLAAQFNVSMPTIYYVVDEAYRNKRKEYSKAMNKAKKSWRFLHPDEFKIYTATRKKERYNNDEEFRNRCKEAVLRYYKRKFSSKGDAV